MTTYPHNKIDRNEFARLAAEGLTPTQLAEHFNAHRDTIWAIRRELGMSTRTRRTKIDRQELMRLHQQGHTTTEIAQHFQARPDTISRIKNELGITENHIITPERLATITRMVEDGWSYAEIHRTEGASLDTLRKYFPGQSWTQEQTTEYLQLRRLETGQHFNRRPNTYNPNKYPAQTHPVGATTHPGSTTLEAAAPQHGHNGAESVQEGRGRVIGHAA